jgi:hypothetical protein
VPRGDPRDNIDSIPTADHVSAINQMFTEFQLAYHNQFHKAFSTDQQIIMAKQLWAKTLSDLPAARIMAGARRAIKGSEYLPTIHSVRNYCDLHPEELGLPDPYNAYLEACRAASPKSEQRWSHPAVYFAGRASDWFFLASSSEQKALPVFKRNYALLCERIISGEQLSMPLPKALPEKVERVLSNDQRRQRLQKMRRELDI